MNDHALSLLKEYLDRCLNGQSVSRESEFFSKIQDFLDVGPYVTYNIKDYQAAVAERADRWVPACGGHEVPNHYRSGARLLYCYNPRRCQHAYLNLDTDLILDDNEARRLIGT